VIFRFLNFYTLYALPHLRFERFFRCVVIFTITLAVLFVSSANRNSIFGPIQEHFFGAIFILKVETLVHRENKLFIGGQKNIL